MNRVGLVIINIIFSVYILVVTTVYGCGELGTLGYLIMMVGAITTSLTLQVTLLFLHNWKLVDDRGHEVIDLKPYIKDIINVVLDMPKQPPTIGGEEIM